MKVYDLRLSIGKVIKDSEEHKPEYDFDRVDRAECKQCDDCQRNVSHKIKDNVQCYQDDDDRDDNEDYITAHDNK